MFGVWNFMTFGFLSCNLFFVLTKPISYVDYFVNRLIFLLFSLFSTDEFLLTRCSMSTICSSSFDCMTSELLLLPISYSISFLFSLTCCSYSPHSSSILMPMSNISWPFISSILKLEFKRSILRSYFSYLYFFFRTLFQLMSWKNLWDFMSAIPLIAPSLLSGFLSNNYWTISRHSPLRNWGLSF